MLLKLHHHRHILVRIKFITLALLIAITVHAAVAVRGSHPSGLRPIDSGGLNGGQAGAGAPAGQITEQVGKPAKRGQAGQGVQRTGFREELGQRNGRRERIVGDGADGTAGAARRIVAAVAVVTAAAVLEQWVAGRTGTSTSNAGIFIA